MPREFIDPALQRGDLISSDTFFMDDLISTIMTTLGLLGDEGGELRAAMVSRGRQRKLVHKIVLLFKN